MKRWLVFLWLGSLALTVRGDDVDIYRRAQFAAIAERPLVLVVDWAGVARSGAGAELVQGMLAALERHLSWRESQQSPADFGLALLMPPELGCESSVDCEFKRYQLREYGDLHVSGSLDTLAADLESLLAAASDPGRGFADYTLKEVWPQLRSLLDLAGYEPGCDGVPVLHLLQSDITLSTTTIDAAWTQGLRTTFLVSRSSGHYERVADLANAKLVVAASVAGLSAAIQSSLENLDEVSSALMSASVPAFSPDASVNGADVLFPLFRPAHRQPWPGNLKALRLVVDGRGGALLARAPLQEPPLAGIDPKDGAIHREALTFWTDPQAPDVLRFDPALGEVPGADGRSVTRGGAGQGVPGLYRGTVGERNSDPGARQVYLLTGEVGSLLPPLDADSTTVHSLGLAEGESLQDSLDLVRYIRGMDAQDEDGDGDTREPRLWLLGAVMHSQPLVINYGARPGSGHTAQSPDVRVVYGSNDGLLRMLASSPAASGFGDAGREVWAVFPPVMLPLQKVHAGLQSPQHPGIHYGVDGSPVAHVMDIDGDGNIEPEEGDRVWLYFGLRRGGAGYYALDISDPDRPRALWQITGASPGFERMALGFSTPRLLRLNLGETQPRLGLVFAGGYNGGWRGAQALGKDGAGGEDTYGNALYVVDATTGALLWHALGPGAMDPNEPAQIVLPNMTHSIPAPVTALDMNGDGFTDRAYVADSGGQVWRIDFLEPGADFEGGAREVIANWSVHRLASLGGSGAEDRRFFHAVDVARTRDGLGSYDALVLTSGNRARPNDKSVADYAYLIKDRGSDTDITQQQLTDVTELCRSPASQECQAADLARGWKLALTGLGEKGLSRPLLRSGVVYFTTYRPPVIDDEVCTSGLGMGAAYALALADAAPALRETYGARNWASEEELPPVDVRQFALGSGIPGPFVPFRDMLLIPGNGPDGNPLVAPPGALRWRSHWRENGVDRP